MKSWEDKLSDEMKQFREETKCGTKTFRGAVIPVGYLPEMLEKARNGDQDARDTFEGLEHWFSMAEAAYKKGNRPGCLSCEAVLDKGQVHGFLVLSPHIRDETGLCGVICEDCMSIGPEFVIKKSIETLREEFGDAQALTAH